jgi:hypothetical protein
VVFCEAVHSVAKAMKALASIAIEKKQPFIQADDDSAFDAAA